MSFPRVLAALVVAVLGVAFLVTDSSAQKVILGENWQNMPGRAKDIGAGADGTVWIIGENQSPYRWNDAAYAWEQASGSAARIAVLPDGTPVIVNAKEEIFRRRGQNWQQLPGRAKDIGAGADGSIWIIGTNDSPYKWNENGYAWEQAGGTGTRITVLPDGIPVIKNAKEEVFRLRGQNWQHLPGRATDVAAGADGSIWIIGENESPYRWNDDAYAWEQKQGHGVQIAIAGPGIPWLVNAGEEIFRLVARIVEEDADDN